MVDEIEIEQILMDVGIPAHLLGWRYSKKAIMIALEDENKLTLITRNLYPDVAKAFKTTSSGVERGIRNALKKAWRNTEHIKKSKITQYVPHDKRFTNKEFIAVAVGLLKFKMQREELKTKS